MSSAPDKRDACNSVGTHTNPLQWLLVLSLLLTLGCSTGASWVGIGEEAPAVVRAEYFAAPNKPSFAVEVFRDGRVKWEGSQRVKTLGVVVLQIDPNEVLKLLDELDRIGFRTLKPEYRPGLIVSDGTFPGPAYTVRTDKYQHTVRFFGAAGQDLRNALYNALSKHVPFQDLRCPYIARFPDRDAGYEICSGKQIYTDRQMIELEERK